MRNTITRSFVKLSCDCIVYKDGKTVKEIVTIPYGYNTTDSAEKYIRKNVALDGKLVMVESVSKVSALYGMDESEFIKLAKVVTERSKETRDCINEFLKYPKESAGSIMTIEFVSLRPDMTVDDAF